MVKRDEGPVDTVGWGPFALFGERKRLKEAEKRRTEEVNARAASRPEPTSRPAKTPEAVDVDAVKERVADPFRQIASSGSKLHRPGIQNPLLEASPSPRDEGSPSRSFHQGSYARVHKSGPRAATNEMRTFIDDVKSFVSYRYSPVALPQAPLPYGEFEWLNDRDPLVAGSKSFYMFVHSNEPLAKIYETLDALDVVAWYQAKSDDSADAEK